MSRVDLLNKLNEYFLNGGLFNPENMDHKEVRQLLSDIRDYLNYQQVK